MFHKFLTFCKIGAFTLGGGYAMIPLLEREVVDKNAWLSKEDFMDIMAVSQATPGLFAINMASHIGNKIGGWKLGAVCSLGVALPSIVCILLIAMFFNAFRDNIYIEKIFRGIRPAVVALIAVPTFRLGQRAKLNWYTIWIPVVCALAIWALGVSPIYIILIAGLAGYLYGMYIKPTQS